EAARDAAAKARELQQVRAERDRAVAQAGAAAAAARLAGANADAAGVAADEAGRQSGVSARQAQRARDAAAQARRAAATAGRAADRAESLARQAREASEAAFGFAQQAAQHADNAVQQALAAAAAAERGELSAAEAARHAQAAVDAANVAVRAAAQAVQLEALARAEDETRLAEWTEQGVQAAQAALAAEQEQAAAGGELVAWNRSLWWDTAEQDRINAATRTLLNEASAAGAPAAVVMDRGRRAAVALVTTGGEWTRQAAQDVLGGDEAEMRLWLTEGRRTAAGQDDRARVWRLVDTLPDGPEKTAAQTALNGDDAAVESFLRTRSYTGKTAKDRQAVYAILGANPKPGPNVTAAANAALAGTAQQLHEFLRTGLYTARAADERIEAYRVMEAGGPEVKAAAQVALAGPASYVSYFLTTSRYQAQQRDLEQAAHVATVTKLIAEAQQFAQKALEDADRAVEAAKRAQGYVTEANAARARADAAARKAVDFANQAKASADAAKRSADQAAQSAVTARNAANNARASANQAARSAATATAAAQRARSDADAAYRAKREARSAADAAGRDAAAAAQAAREATEIYLTRLEQVEKDRRSTAPGSGPNGNGTALDNHKTWGCLNIDPSSVSKQCLTVFKDFAFALIGKVDCGVPANADNTGCAMLSDLKQFIGENEAVLLDMLQFTLMACGLIPGAGEACDAIDAAVSFGRGDVAGGLLSMGSAIPFVGWAATGLKGWKNSDKFRNIKNLVEKMKKNDSCPLSATNSFVPGTRVLLAGRRTKQIEKVHVGDAVVATDPTKNRTAVKAVTATVGSIAVKRIVDVAIDEDGDDATKPAIISATAEHPFWVPALRAWVPAKSLGAGFSVQTLDGRPAAITKVSERTAAARAHNFTVAEIHTYYVMANNTPVLVHNACSRTSGNNVAARNGTAIHGDFDRFLRDVGNGYSGARTLSSGRRIDGAYLDPRLGEIPIELKPNNPNQLRRGWNQLAQYETDMGAPAGSGQLWVYDVGPGGQIFFTRVL
ncbi:MAG TPA: polymorphic toxin-type HINT domain-containing protein, partial [Actinoplanes sp.]|nr:polymorphic toxin-type HINT domain-containing protein [Actinoplanes sp.]